MMALATAAIQFVVLGLCLRAEQRISALKTYYPMLRILLGIIGALYGVGAIATASGHLDQSPVVRLGGALVALAGLWWANRFIDRRNNNPQFVMIDLAGHIETRTTDELHIMLLNVGSWARHGAMPPTEVAQLEADIAGWHEHQAWRERLAAQALERRAAHDAVPGDEP